MSRNKGVDYQSTEYINTYLVKDTKPINYQELNKDSLMNERPALNLTDSTIENHKGDLLYPDHWGLVG